MTHWKIHVLYLGDITIPKAMGTMGLDMNPVLPVPSTKSDPIYFFPLWLNQAATALGLSHPAG
jgi:hypothetical protein